MNPKLTLAALAGLILGAIAAIAIVAQQQNARVMPPATQTSGKALVGGPFTLVDHTGKRVSEKDYSGRYTLVFFGFTACPDICPAGLQLIAAVLDELGPKAERVTPILISVDPERDTPERLGEYVTNFHPNIVGLTGTPEEVAAAAKAYRVYYKKVTEEGAPPDEYTMDHSAIIYFMDPQGEFIAHFTPTTSIEEMAARIEEEM